MKMPLLVEYHLQGSAHILCVEHTQYFQFILHGLGQRLKIFVEIKFLCVSAGSAEHHLVAKHLFLLSPQT